MKTKIIMTLVLTICLVGCAERAVQPAAKKTASTGPPDAQALQELRDLGVSPQTALQIVREELQRRADDTAAAQAAVAPAATEPSPAPGSVAVPGEAEPMARNPPAAPAGSPEVTGREQQAADEPAGSTAPAAAGNAAEVEIPAPTVAATAPAVQNVSDFYSALAPYGRWIDVPPYGQVWQPYATVADPDWRPYCQDGSWLWTDDGWYWNSYYAWGWAPFHYGRWCHTPVHRWCWMPDVLWAPAWVCWRSTSDCFGWAALPPGAWCGTGVGLAWNVDDPFFCEEFGVSSFWFTFVPARRFCDRDLRRVCLRDQRLDEVFRHSTFVRHAVALRGTRVFNAGVSKAEVERALGSGIAEHKIVKRAEWPAEARIRPARGEGRHEEAQAIRAEPPIGRAEKGVWVHDAAPPAMRSAEHHPVATIAGGERRAERTPGVAAQINGKAEQHLAVSLEQQRVEKAIHPPAMAPVLPRGPEPTMMAPAPKGGEQAVSPAIQGAAPERIWKEQAQALPWVTPRGAMAAPKPAPQTPATYSAPLKGQSSWQAPAVSVPGFGSGRESFPATKPFAPAFTTPPVRAPAVYKYAPQDLPAARGGDKGGGGEGFVGPGYPGGGHKR